MASAELDSRRSRAAARRVLETLGATRDQIRDIDPTLLVDDVWDRHGDQMREKIADGNRARADPEGG